MKEVSRRKAIPKNRVEPEVEEAVVQLAIEQPALGQVRVSNELRKRGVFISPCGVRCVWQRHDMETFLKRLAALEAKVAQEGLILTEAQMIAMERKREKREASGEIEQNIQGIWDLMTPTMSATSKVLAESISKLSSIHIRKLLLLNFMIGRMPSLRLICSTIR